jgi:two-component system, sporulation sensor kinase E
MEQSRRGERVPDLRDGQCEPSPPGGPSDQCGGLACDANLIDGLDGVLSILIHSGKNHLGPIKGYASLIQDDTDETSNARRWADKIMRNVRQMEDHLDSLDMFRLKGTLGVAEVSWHRIVCEVVDRFAAINAKGVPIEIINEVRGTFRQHKEPLKRLLVHLIVNAYESIAETGKVTLAISPHTAAPDGRRRFVVWIKDTGCGIDGEVTRRIWTPFYTTKDDHVGLGLPYVAAAAAAMEIGIELVSTPGQGTAVGLIITEQGG